MVETEYRLDEAARATIAADGTGQVLNVGPKLPGERWHITIMSANGPAGAKLQVMRGNSFDASRQLDVTVRADADTSACDITLMSGEVVSFWWTNGTAGSVMTCSLNGSRYVQGRRAY